MENKEPKLIIGGIDCAIENLRECDLIAKFDSNLEDFFDPFFVKRVENQRIYGVFIDSRNGEEKEFTHKDWKLIGYVKTYE